MIIILSVNIPLIFKDTRNENLSAALMLMIIALAVAISAVIDEYIHRENISGIVLLTCVAIAVFVFIYQGIVYGMYQFLVKNKEFIIEKRKEEKSLFAFTMPLAAMIYLVMGFTRNWWHPGWIVFPVVAIITLGIENMMEREK